MPETSKFLDRFDRVDGEIGTNFLIACGEVLILDEVVWPVSVEANTSPGVLEPTIDRKVQVLYQGATLDSPHFAARAIWSHVADLPGIAPISDLLTEAAQDPSFTILARMSKDPLLLDLEASQAGGSARSYAFEPTCYDQGYGLRVTCPRDGAAPVLKLIKYSPPAIGPGHAGPASATEVDRARVLTSIVLEAKHLHLEVDDDIATYRGLVQEMRLRIRRTDGEVILEAFLNDRNMNIPILTYTDRQQPLWGAIGLPGFEFLNAIAATQPAGTSPFTLKGIPVMACHLFEVETVKDYAHPQVSSPDNLWTYRRVAERVALLVEKDGDTKWTATARSLARLQTYEDFVCEAEMDLLRVEGYWWFLERKQRFWTKAGMAEYEVPENCEKPLNVYQVSAPARPLTILLDSTRREAQPNPDTGGLPMVASFFGVGVNDRMLLQLTPTPGAECEMELLYYARFIRPNDTTRELPLVPQAHMDALIYKACGLASLHNTDMNDRNSFHEVGSFAFASLRRANNRNTGRRSVLRHADQMNTSGSYPLTRAAQLGHGFP